MIIQAVYDFICSINGVLHIATDRMLEMPILRHLGIALSWAFDGFKEMQYHLLFSDLIKLQPNPDQYSVWHYRVNYGLHWFFAILFIVVVVFIMEFLVGTVIAKISLKIETKKIRKLEELLNQTLHEAGSDAVYHCRYEDWKCEENYDRDPCTEACKYMHQTIDEIHQFTAAGGNGKDIKTVNDVYWLNIESIRKSRQLC